MEIIRQLHAPMALAQGRELPVSNG